MFEANDIAEAKKFVRWLDRAEFSDIKTIEQVSYFSDRRAWFDSVINRIISDVHKPQPSPESSSFSGASQAKKIALPDGDLPPEPETPAPT